jgi:hypothetical protein
MPDVAAGLEHLNATGVWPGHEPARGDGEVQVLREQNAILRQLLEAGTADTAVLRQIRDAIRAGQRPSRLVGAVV